MNNLTPHQKALLFTGLMQMMVEHLDQFTVDQVREMNALSAKNRELYMQNLEKSDSSDQVMILARFLSQ